MATCAGAAAGTTADASWWRCCRGEKNCSNKWRETALASCAPAARLSSTQSVHCLKTAVRHRARNKLWDLPRSARKAGVSELPEKELNEAREPSQKNWLDSSSQQWASFLRNREEQVFLVLTLLIGALVGLVVVAFILVT